MLLFIFAVHRKNLCFIDIRAKFMQPITLNNLQMKKNLLAAIAIFFFTFAILLAMSDITKSEKEIQYTVSND